jgi:DHA2 family lincomycin resistance protein-like MFS transporter
MVIRDCMKTKVFFIPSSASISEAAAVFVKRHIGLLPVIDETGKPVGVLHLADLLTLELPDFVGLIADLDFVHDFGAVETTRPTHAQLEKPVTTLMQKVVTVPDNSGLLRAYALMLQDNHLDMPVVNKAGALVGIVSRVDIGAAILSLWPQKAD